MAVARVRYLLANCVKECEREELVALYFKYTFFHTHIDIYIYINIKVRYSCCFGHLTLNAGGFSLSFLEYELAIASLKVGLNLV